MLLAIGLLGRFYDFNFLFYNSDDDRLIDYLGGFWGLTKQRPFSKTRGDGGLVGGLATKKGGQEYVGGADASGGGGELLGGLDTWW